jgi:hypothetical protein
VAHNNFSLLQPKDARHIGLSIRDTVMINEAFATPLDRDTIHDHHGEAASTQDHFSEFGRTTHDNT